LRQGDGDMSCPSHMLNQTRHYARGEKRHGRSGKEDLSRSLTLHRVSLVRRCLS
jgi:hypothetical protein